MACGFLLEIDLGAGFLEGIVVTVEFFACGGLRGGGFGFGAVDAAGALVHGALQRAEENGAHEKIKKKNDDYGGQSLNDQVTELVEDFHFQQTAALRSSWIWRLIERRMRSGHTKTFRKARHYCIRGEWRQRGDEGLIAARRWEFLLDSGPGRGILFCA